MFSSPPAVATYPDLELDPAVQAEKAKLEGDAR
jgi:hypothetical protein